MALRKLFPEHMRYLSTEEVERGFEAAEQRMQRGEELENFEQLWSNEAQAAWKKLSEQDRLYVLEELVESGGVRSAVIPLFPALAKTDDIATFGDIGESRFCANFRDSVLSASFDFKTNTFTLEQYRKTMAERFAQVESFMKSS